MAKKKHWFDRLKKFLSTETQSKQEKNDRRRRWLFGRLKPKCSPALPAPSFQRSRSLREAEQEQSKHAVAVAVATAAAAEAAVAAAHAAAQVVRLTGSPLSYHQPHDIAAVKIQASFRGYLARRALRALKGLVKLQALIRGQAVRRQTNITLKGLQSLMKIQSMARANRMRAVVNRLSDEIKDVFHLTETEEKESDHARTECSDRKWDGSMLSKEEIVALLRRRQEAALRRERAAEYASSRQRRIGRRSTASVEFQVDANTLEPKWSWLDHWVDSQHIDKDIHEVFPTPTHAQDARNLQTHTSESLSILDSEYDGKAKELELRYPARRSFNRSGRDQTKIDDCLSKSPNYPSYMVSTASIKAKFRSMSTPKLRRGSSDFLDPSNINTDKLLSPLPSNKAPLNYQSSALFRGQASAAKHSRSSNYHSIDSKRSLLNWDAPSPVR